MQRPPEKASIKDAGVRRPTGHQNKPWTGGLIPGFSPSDLLTANETSTESHSLSESQFPQCKMVN